MALADEGDTRDLEVEDSEELGRKHRKRKKHQQPGPCGFGRTFGSHDVTYISAPVNNYFLGCGPSAPAPIYPQQIQQHHGHSGHGHGGHSHGGHGHGGHGQGGLGSHGNQGLTGYGGYGMYGGYGGQQFFGAYPQQGQFGGQYQRPFQGAVSAAASGLGSALANYITRPRRTQHQINQLLRPIYKLF